MNKFLTGWLMTVKGAVVNFVVQECDFQLGGCAQN